MPTKECQCGARYRFPESVMGKRAKCQKCGAVLTLEAEVDPGVLAIRDEPAAPEPAPPMSSAYVPSAESAGRLGHAVVEEDTSPPSYARSLLQTLLFPTELANLGPLIFMWAMVFISAALLPFAPCVGGLGQIIILGWYSAFRLSVIEDAAAGEKQLPTLALTNGAYDDILVPFLKWVGSWVIVLAPALIYLLVMVSLGLSTPASPAALLQGLGGILPYATGDVIVFEVLVYAGLFLWPMVVLCIALGGFSSFNRPDLIAVTLCRTFPMYLLTAGIVFGVSMIGDWLVGDVPVNPWDDVFGFFGWMLIASGTSVYLEIVSIRAIGLYYYHFKDRFAWSWE